MRITLHNRHIRYFADVPVFLFRMDASQAHCGHPLHKYSNTLVRLQDIVDNQGIVAVQYDCAYTAEFYDGATDYVYGDELTRVFL